MRFEFPFRATASAVVLAGVAAVVSPPVQAGLLEGLFGKQSNNNPNAPAAARPGKKLWEVRNFSRVMLAPKEAGAVDSDHPLQLQPEGLRQALGKVRVKVNGRDEALFAGDELDPLIEPLQEAFASARPDEDVLLLSTDRREAGLIGTPMGVTARLFVKDGQLNLIVRDARLDFVNRYRGTGTLPTFQYGSRSAVGSADLSAPQALQRRPDWLALSLNPAAEAPKALSLPVPLVAPAATVAPASAAVQPAATARPRDPGLMQEIELRLETLKRLRDKGLISEEEYQQKRRDILQTL
jgi:hypothetical protein